jgi:hypothetical protein
MIALPAKRTAKGELILVEKNEPDYDKKRF